jgi:hypothetical protein
LDTKSISDSSGSLFFAWKKLADVEWDVTSDLLRREAEASRKGCLPYFSQSYRYVGAET